MKAIFSFVWISLTLSGAFAQSLKTDYSFRKYLLENVHYPEAAIQQGVSDKAYAFFEVGTNGKVINVKTACGHQGMGFEQAIEQTLLAAPMQAKSATGKYLVHFEFNLLAPKTQSRNNAGFYSEVSVDTSAVDTLFIPEGTVQLNKVKIEAIASAKTISSVTAKKSNSPTTSTKAAQPTTRPPTSPSTTTLSDRLTYTMRKAEREHKLKSKKTEKELGAVTVTYEYPLFNDETLNAVLRRKFIQQVSFDAAADAYMKEHTPSDYKDEDFPLSGFNQGYSLSTKVIRQNTRFVFFKADWSEDNYGAAHGQYGEAYLIYDRNSQQMLKLDNILTGGGRYELRQIAERVFRREEKLSPNASLCDNYLFDKCRFELAENFTVTENALEFIYNNYEAKSFNMGIWSIKLPYSLIKHLINPEYSGLFKQVVTPTALPNKESPTSIAETGANLLFKSTKSQLNDAEKSAIYKLLGFTLSADKKGFFTKYCENRPFDEFDVTIEDLNGDGVEEVEIVYGNDCTSGFRIAKTAVLFIKNQSGVYQKNLDFPSLGYTKLAAKSLGFPDLVFLGPGFEHPIWRWNGKEYQFYRMKRE